MNRIYLDYAATTPVDKRVLEAMRPFWRQKFGNSTSLHFFGQEAQEALEESRQTLAQAINADPEEIIFTSSATESNNFALKGVAFANRQKGRHLLISAIEHHCVLESANWLKSQGFEIEKISVNHEGLVSPREVEAKIKKDTILVSVMHANNEIGTVEPIGKIGKICRERGVYFHTDAAQTLGKIPLDVKKENIDLLTASSHKIYGPKGAACLYIRKGVNIEPLLHGGGQEFGKRSSTVNVPAIVGFAKAVNIALKNMDEENKEISRLRDKLIKGVLKTIPGAHLNGHPTKRLANNANFWFEFVEGEAIIFELDRYGIAASTASACSSPKLEPSHVLLACGLAPQEAHGSLRLSLGRWTTEEEIDKVLAVLPQVIAKLRRVSPFGKRE
ncbi:cysteine desulfurase NifS [Candidatus Shapirobacteria bacterium]|nr:cysteine desulfurase NifS [Candidatus Shapirobacteria bacterium]